MEEKYDDLEISDIRCLKELEAKNLKPKRMFAKLQLQEENQNKNVDKITTAYSIYFNYHELYIVRLIHCAYYYHPK